MRLNCAEGNDVCLAGRTLQSIVCIACTVFNVSICRTFLRAVLLLVVDRQWIITARSRRYRPHGGHMEIGGLAGLSSQ
jgi:hypothetical protein